MYDFVEKKLFYRNLFTDNDIFEYSNEQAMDRFIQCFKVGLLNMQEAVGCELWLSLTGGHDSRTLMALMEYAGIEYNCFTLEVGNLSVGDRELPKLLAKQQKHRYVFLKRKFNQFSARRLKNYISHSGGFAKDEDVWFYAFGQYQQLNKLSDNVVILRGGIWDICIGCWLSSIEQSCDIMDNITFLQPCNCRMFLALLFSMVKVEKKPWKKKHQEKIIEKCCQALLNVDFESNLGNKYGKRSLGKRIYTRLFYNLADAYLYGFKGWLISRGIFLYKAN